MEVSSVAHMKKDHLDITSNSFRRKSQSLATILNITDLSISVKKLELEVHDKNVSFKAGQWVDFFIPNVTTVGGFSMCSTPQLLQKQGRLELAVKYSEHPPAKWVHSKCQIGDHVSVKVGGDFFCDPCNFIATSDHPLRDFDVLLIAGGVGINPILSIFAAFAEAKETHRISAKVDLLFSAKTEQELLFKDRLNDIARHHSDMAVRYFVTRDTEVAPKDMECSRITEDYLKTNLANRLNKQVVVYLCGPPTMIDGLVDSILECGIPEAHVCYEKWW